MHPPFIFTDHLIGPNPVNTDSPNRPRRTLPARLDMRTAVAGWPPIALPEPGPLPGRFHYVRQKHLRVVDPPRNTLRDNLGRFLIRLGQRIIMQQRPG